VLLVLLVLLLVLVVVVLLLVLVLVLVLLVLLVVLLLVLVLVLVLVLLVLLLVLLLLWCVLAVIAGLLAPCPAASPLAVHCLKDLLKPAASLGCACGGGGGVPGFHHAHCRMTTARPSKTPQRPTKQSQGHLEALRQAVRPAIASSSSSVRRCRPL
jgi:energy-coupling factor transporter transmembrane protein EcfT